MPPGLLERPALRSLVPANLAGAAVLDAGCGSGAQAQWLLDQGADVIGIIRCGGAAGPSSPLITPSVRACQASTAGTSTRSTTNANESFRSAVGSALRAGTKCPIIRVTEAAIV